MRKFRFNLIADEVIRFIREEVKAELNRREKEDDDSYYNADDNPPVKTGTVQLCTSCDEVVHPDPYNPNYLRCGCNLIGQVDYSDRNIIPSWRPARVEIRMKKEEI